MYEIGTGGIDRTHWERCDMHIMCWVNFRERFIDVFWNITVAEPSGKLSFTRPNPESRLSEFQTSCETRRIGMMRKIDKLSLCTIRWPAGSGFLAALTFKLCTIRKWAAYFTHRPLYSRGNYTSRIGVCVCVGGTGGRFGCRIGVLVFKFSPCSKCNVFLFG